MFFLLIEFPSDLFCLLKKIAAEKKSRQKKSGAAHIEKIRIQARIEKI